jgi:hypothetical protein
MSLHEGERPKIGNQSADDTVQACVQEAMKGLMKAKQIGLKREIQFRIRDTFFNFFLISADPNTCRHCKLFFREKNRKQAHEELCLSFKYNCRYCTAKTRNLSALVQHKKKLNL